MEQLPLWDGKEDPPISNETIFAYCPMCFTRLYRLPNPGTFMAICVNCGWNRVDSHKKALVRYGKSTKPKQKPTNRR
jgi:hypothetical protein